MKRTFGQFLQEAKYKSLRKALPNEPQVYEIHGYHSTSVDNWKSILKTGLIPGKAKPAGQDWAGTWSGKATYCHLSLPDHELDSGYDEDSGEIFMLTIEFKTTVFAEYIVPDEEVNKDVDYTPKAIKNKEALAIGYQIPVKDFICVWLPSESESNAAQWAEENIPDRFDVKYVDRKE
jgi:hypothetical protein